MTFKEKLQEEHPELVSARYFGGCANCPHTYGYESEDNKPCRTCKISCRECWNRTIPCTEEPSIKPAKPNVGLNDLIERAGTKKDISLMIHINGDDTTISVYPCPDPSEKKGNPVAEAYRILVNSGYRLNGVGEAIRKLESENTNLVEQLDKKCFTCVSFNNRIAIERFAELLKLKAHPEDGCGLDCIYVTEIDDELARIKTEELNKNDQN